MDLHSPSRSVGLSSLPNEILLLILGNFCLHCRDTHGYFQGRGTRQRRSQPSWYSLDCQALYSVCLVSTRFRHVAQPILYHEFSPGYGDSWRSTQYSWSSRLPSFLQTVSLRPDLAAQVRMLYLSRTLLNSISMDMVEIEATLEVAARTRGVQLSSFLAPFKHRWASESEPYRPSGEELAVILLACLSNITCFRFSQILNDIPLSALKAAGLSGLPIQTVDLRGLSFHLSGQLNGILEMSLSTLRTLNLHSCGGWVLRYVARPLPNLKNVCITNSKLRVSGPESDLAHFLSYCVGLESFIYEAGESFVSWREHTVVARYHCRR